MKRREFIAVLGGAVSAWPLGARAQQTRRVGVMVALPEDDPELKKRLAAFRQALNRLGWSEGRNVSFDYRFAPAGARARVRDRATLAPARRNPSFFDTGYGHVSARNSYDPHRIHWRRRCRHPRLRPKLSKSGSQSYWSNDV